MPDSLPTISLTARYVFPVSGPPLAGGCVTMRGKRIIAVEPRPRGDCLDLGDAAILPGFVNAHTHLEFSHFDAPLGRSGMPLPEWIRQVIASRRAADHDLASSIARGIGESLRTGTTTLAEIATSGWTAESLAAAPLDLVAFYELLGLSPERVPDRLEDAQQFIDRAMRVSGWRGGISPHAPYSVHPELVVGLVRLATAHGLPVAMHLAESREELELLAAGSGPFRDMLVELGVWEAAAFPHGTRPLEYLQLLAAAPRSLVIHGNYLDGEEIEYLAMHAERMAVVFCPRTHTYFAHESYPLSRLLSLGVSVALGTDSRASNPDLSLLAEMRHVVRHMPAVAPADVLNLGTRAGARALGREAEVGTLELGKLANLAIVALPTQAAADPHALLFDSNLPVVDAYYEGRRVTGGNS